MSPSIFALTSFADAAQFGVAVFKTRVMTANIAFVLYLTSRLFFFVAGTCTHAILYRYLPVTRCHDKCSFLLVGTAALVAEVFGRPSAWGGRAPTAVGLSS